MRLPFVKLYLILLLIGPCVNLSAQETWPFEKEVANIVAGDSSVNKKRIILFTGSSSIRLWKDMQTYFPSHNVLNRGFGGSQMKDLLHYVDKLILPYNPRMIFIYEGDNDLASNKTSDEIIASADSILNLIRTKLPRKVKVVFISTKPSIARWEMKDRYMAFNEKLRVWATTKKNVKFVDVWTPMLDEKGELQEDLFIEDGLHMNKKGYDIWGNVIRKYVK